MAQDDDAAWREERAARLRSRIERINRRAPDDQPDASGVATTNTTSVAGGARDGQSGTDLDEQTWQGEGENPRDFVQRKMREQQEREKK
jgi:hypothetical protein